MEGLLYVVSGMLLQMVDFLFCYTLLTYCHANLDTVAYYYFVAVKLISG